MTVPTDLPGQPIGTSLDAIIGRLSYDDDFAAALAQDPAGALDQAGLHMQKTDMEQFLRDEPDRFDRICNRLSELISPEIVGRISEPTCA